MMILVAFVAFGIEGMRTFGRRSLCRQRAGIMARWATSYREIAAGYDDSGNKIAAARARLARMGASASYTEGRCRGMAEMHRAFARWADSVRDVYEAGEARPWRPIPPEPPRPAPMFTVPMPPNW